MTNEQNTYLQGLAARVPVVKDNGDWVQTLTGKAFDVFDPLEYDIDILDIAHSLSRICRFNGHCHTYYSVAEHSVLVSYFVSPKNALWGLLHDAPEAYIGDIVRPIKRRLDRETNGLLTRIEDNLMAVIAKKFGLEGTTIPDEVKEIDAGILGKERECLMNPSEQPWSYSPTLMEYPLYPPCYTRRSSKVAFLRRLEELTGIPTQDMYYITRL